MSGEEPNLPLPAKRGEVEQAAAAAVRVRGSGSRAAARFQRPSSGRTDVRLDFSPQAGRSEPARDTPARLAWARLRGRPSAVVGLAVVALVIAAAILAPLISPYDPAAQSYTTIRRPPTLAHLLGTDETGRDILSRIVWGARASLSAGLVSVVIAIVAGVPVGLAAGYVGGLLDGLVSRMTDAMLACPFLILAIALAAFLGPSLTNAMIAIGVTATPIFIRLTRGQVLAIAAEPYVEAARAAGIREWRIAAAHVLPNALPQLLVQASLTVATAIIAEASLSFLGLGQQPPAPSWGSMLNTAQRFLTNAPWMAVSPGLAIFVTVLSFNLFGDGLRDALDPRQT